MSTEYDSSKIRRLAAQVGNVADSVSKVRSTNLRAIQREMPGQFSGEAAKALQDAVGDLEADIYSLSRELLGIRAALLALANRVDEADRQAKELILRQ